MVVEQFRAYGKVATQDGKAKYPMFRLSWDSTDETGFLAILGHLPEAQRTEDFVLDKKLECVQTTRYGDFVFTILEDRTINNLLEEERHISQTLRDWQEIDTMCQAFSQGGDRFSRFRRNIRYAPVNQVAQEEKSEEPVVDSPVATYECEVCWDDVTADEQAFLDCGHYTCKGCMVRHINAQVEMMNISGMKCPHRKTMICQSHISEAEVKSLLPKDDFANYTRQKERQRELLAHANDKTNVDPVFAKWLKENAKHCPGCNVPVQKNGGCSHMTCVVDGCKSEWCWYCRGPYKGAKFYCFKCENCKGTGKEFNDNCMRCDGLGRNQIPGPFPGGCNYSFNSDAVCIHRNEPGKDFAGVYKEPEPDRAPVRSGAFHFGGAANQAPRARSVVSYWSSWT